MNWSIKLVLPGAILALGLIGVCAETASAELYPNQSALDQAFHKAGWDAEWLADGSVNLRPTPTPADAPVDSLRPTPALADAPGDSAAQSPAANGEQQKWDRLRAMGWRVEKSPDGSTLLYPPGEDGPAQKPSQARAATGAPATAPQPKLEDLLRARNWRVERAKDGSLLLYPQARKEGGEWSGAAKVEPCPGVVPTPANDVNIELPVDQWAEAKLIAQAWIDRFGGPGLAVGKIRKVLRVYVVSVVETAPPFRLRHQIVVNAQDARTIVLN